MIIEKFIIILIYKAMKNYRLPEPEKPDTTQVPPPQKP
jgi:hypothetical protein